ncbi:MAG: prepilin-type N-terminal cleavage/methylation domain-containing protein [Candidatus Saccharimonadales bacterium]
MKMNIKKRTEGFTIIEVLIVLAIAGLIMLVVFLAVPALQRNGRNTAIKTDASAIAGGVGEFASNNNGIVANNATGTGTVVIKAATGTPTNAKVQGTTVVSTITSWPATAPDPGNIFVLFGKKCDQSSSTRATAIIYSTENSGTAPQQQCLEG